MLLDGAEERRRAQSFMRVVAGQRKRHKRVGRHPAMQNKCAVTNQKEGLENIPEVPEVC